MTIGPRVQELVSSLGPKIGEQQSQATSLATAKFYMDQLQSISSRRQELVTAENAAVTAGAQTQTEAEQHIKAAYAETTPEIEKAAAALKEFLATDKNIDPVRVELYTAKMKALSAEAQYVSPQFKELKSVIENSFVSNATNALNTVTEAIGNAIAKTAQWKDVWRSVGVAAAQFFAGLLKDIATAIIKMEVLKALGLGGGGGISGDIAGFFTGGSTGSGGGGLFGIGGLFGSQGPLFGTAADASIAAGGPPLALALHSGGVVGRSGTPRSVSPTWFANAPRYHSGSIVGLAPDEQAAILRRGEEVLSQGNPRNIMNGGGNGIAIRNVLVMDPMQIPAAMAGAHGEKVTISHIVNNIATVRQLVRG